MNKISLALIALLLFFIIGCSINNRTRLLCPGNAPYMWKDGLCRNVEESTLQVAENTSVDSTQIIKITCPSSCNDNNSCTEDYCNNASGFKCENKKIAPCCGDTVCEGNESYQTCPDDCQKPVDAVTSASMRSKMMI
jgi:hypothetical protein